MSTIAQYAIRLRKPGLSIVLPDSPSKREYKEPPYLIGKLAATMVGGFNEYFSNHLSERMQKAMRASFEAGRYSRRAPLGYKNASNPLPGTANIEPDEAAPLIAKAFELMATGNYTTAEVPRIVNAKGLTTKRGKLVPMQTFVELLKNPVYKRFAKIEEVQRREAGFVASNR